MAVREVILLVASFLGGYLVGEIILSRRRQKEKDYPDWAEDRGEAEKEKNEIH